MFVECLIVMALIFFAAAATVYFGVSSFLGFFVLVGYLFGSNPPLPFSSLLRTWGGALLGAAIFAGLTALLYLQIAGWNEHTVSFPGVAVGALVGLTSAGALYWKLRF
jgi:CDP-diglyceride synthetase